MKKILLASTVAAAFVLGFSSCKKETENNPPTPKNEAPSSFVPGDADFFFKASVFYVSTTSVYGQSSEYKVGDALAFFKNNKVNAGDVTINGLPMTKEESGNYIYKKLGNIPEGITYLSNLAAWTATGDTATGVAPLSINDTTAFPAKPVIQDKKINTQESFLLTAKDTIIADSTVFVVSGPNATLRKVKGPNAKSCTFTKEEMQTLGTGRSLGLIQISPYTTVLDTTVISGAKTYFQKQTITAKYVDLE
ncbi:MAG: hypothetical protein KF872_07390 [Chitinophagales bacterium]|nr:hypothetical protein [Chitinophagales bacterium]